MNLGYGLALSVSTALAVMVIIAAWGRRPSPGAAQLAALGAALFVWSGPYAISWIVTDRATSEFWLLLSYIGVVAVPPLVLALTLTYTGRASRLTRPVRTLLFAEPILTLVVLATDRYTGWFFGGHAITTRILEGGVGFWFNTIFGFVLISMSLVLLGLEYTRAPRFRRPGIAVMFVAVVIPAAGALAGVAQLSPVPDIDLTPFTFTATGLLFGAGLFYLGLLDVVPIARGRMIEWMREGVVILDASGHVVEMNPAACEMAGFDRPRVGVRAAEVFDRYEEAFAAFRAGATEVTVDASGHKPRSIEASRTSIRESADGPVLATIVMLRDVTEQRRLQEEIARQANTDALTGAATRWRFIEAAAVEIERCRRHGHDLALAILDLDDLKVLNDTAGHLAGDRVLQRVATSLAQAVRTGDTIARFGGDEFVVLMPETTADGATTLIRRAQQALADGGPSCDTYLAPPSFSFGVSELTPDMSSPDELIAAADRRLYEAKLERLRA